MIHDSPEMLQFYLSIAFAYARRRDKSSKTEEATPKKKSFEQGISEGGGDSSRIWAGIHFIMLFVTVSAAEKIALMMGYVYSNLAKYLLTHEEVPIMLTGGSAFGILAPAFVLAPSSQFWRELQTRFQLTPKVLQFKFSK